MSEIILGGSSTYSKSKYQFPFDIPSEYLDFSNGLGAVTLGNGVTNEAIKKQLEEGTTFSLPHRLELEVAKKFQEIVPCDMVRFGKNGSDATSGAIRLARHCTGREHIVVCGYHGFQDWYIGSTSMNAGVPKCVQNLTHSFQYGDIESLKKILKKNKIACIIMEPVNRFMPVNGFLLNVQELAREHGALFILDEVLTGFRIANGGGGEYFGIEPDISCFGKAIANGMPLSILCGKRDIMKHNDKVFMSSTFSGETLSLASSSATMNFYQENDVIGHFVYLGWKIKEEVNKLIVHFGLENMVSITGHPAWTFLNFLDEIQYTIFRYETMRRGILVMNSHNLRYDHTEQDIDKLLDAYKEVLPLIRDKNNLKCETIKPLFR